jgi:hypothetical protein
MQKLILGLGLLAVFPRPSIAQGVNALRVGARIEVTAVNGTPRTGRLTLLRNDSLFYSPGMRTGSISETGSVRLAFTDVKSVRVSRGRNVLISILTKGLIGTALGAGVGAGLGAVTWKPSSDFFTSTRPQAAAFFGFLAGASGLIVGSIYGAGHGNENWEPVALPGT